MNTQNNPADNPKKAGIGKKVGIGCGTAAVLVFGVGLIANLTMSDEERAARQAEREAQATTETTTTTTEAATETPTSTTGETTTEATTSQAAGMPWERDARCESADQSDLDMLQVLLTDQSLTLGNGQVIVDGTDKWVGASLLRPDGEFESRDDVWLIRDGAGFTVTGGARNATNLPPASTIGVSAGDETAAAVGRCVVAESMGR